MTILISEEWFSCFLVSLLLLLSCHAVSCHAGAKMKRSKHTFSLSGWLTVQKNVNILGKNIFSMKIPSEGFKILAERKKCSFISLRHAGMSLAWGFWTDVHQRSKLNPFIQIQTPWTIKHLAGFSFFPVCEVLIILKHHRYPGAVQFPVAGKPLLTTSCTSCLLYV